jgi:hypothetical protein
MKKQTKYFLFILLALIFTITGSSAQTIKNNNSKISPLTYQAGNRIAFVLDGKEYNLQQIITHLLKENHDIKQLLYDAEMSDSNYQKFQKKYAFFLIGSARANDTEYSEDLVRFTGTKSKERDASIALSKGFSSGTNITAGFSKNYTNNIDKNPQFGDVRYHQPVFFVKLEQELLKNLFGYQERRQNAILKNSDKMIHDIAVLQASSVIVNSIVKSWQLTMHYSELENAKLKLRETKRVRGIIARNTRIGFSEKFELNLWNSLVASNQAMVANYDYQLKESIRAVKVTFNLPEDFHANNIAIFKKSLPDLNFETAFNKAQKHRADYQNNLLAVQNIQMQLQIFKNDALPSLKGEVSYASAGQRDSYGDALNDSLANKNPSVEAKVSLTYAFDDPEQETNERDAEINLKKSKLELQKSKRTLKNDILNAIDGAKTSYKTYTKAREARIQSERYYASMRKHLRRGKYSSSVVNDALSTMIDSRQRELQALINYNVSLLRFDLAQNCLFINNKIEINKFISKK